MAYDINDLQDDMVSVAKALHLSYRRCKCVTDRWNSGLSDQVPNSGATAKYHTLMTRVGEFVASFESNNNAKLNQILALSNLKLPGD